MLERFARLCEIASPTGSERAVADDVLGELRGLGVEVEEDGAAVAARAGAGNLIARVPGAGEGWVMFAAHLDTVPHDGPVEVAFADGVFRSADETILGADNKAAVTVLVELAARAAEGSPPPRWAWSWSSPSPRRTGCAGPRRSTSGPCGRRSDMSSTTPARSAR
jgi:tripeptide aminopeptidase